MNESRYRLKIFTSTITNKPVYQIETRVGKNGWAVLHDRNKPMRYESAAEAEEEFKKLTTNN